jgi:hypothetical protein
LITLSSAYDKQRSVEMPPHLRVLGSDGRGALVVAEPRGAMARPAWTSRPDGMLNGLKWKAT